ncbi:MAG: nuclear transport factor 2 family protein [Aquincola tertiaricarbonis]|uniref:nuclear transport factor 2 family protein n=1 Tax=Aquincola TaxID=391952 RepID=UPI0006150501|nr:MULTISPECIES: nuclear transport factor 2 family protein [Aquincola]MCR5867368.1 nuclear transport factor 2 family protein [Aquincola sp. J276]
MSHPHKQVLEQANAAISRGDHEGFLALCTEDTRWVFVGDRTLQGKEAVRRWMKESYQRPPEFKVDRMVAEGDTLAAIGEITLHDEAGTASVHAYCDVWRLRDGRLAELQAFVVPQG